MSSFVVKTPYSLGIPLSINIWHDNSGKDGKQNWFLEKIVVIDMENRMW